MGGSRRKLGGEYGQNILYESNFIFNKELGKCGQLFFKKIIKHQPQNHTMIELLDKIIYNSY